MGADHPIAWCHNFEGGRSWYEGAGHVDAAYTDPTFLDHLLGGIEWTAGVVEGGGDCVTFKEVGGLNESAGAGGSNRETKLSGDVADYLADAEAAHDEGRTLRPSTSSSRPRARRTASRTPSWSPRSPTSSSGRKASWASDRPRSTSTA